MAVCARGSVLVFMRYLPVSPTFFFGGGRGYGSDDHQLMFLIWPYGALS